MPALVGRKVLVYKGGSSPQNLVAAGRTKSITVNAEPIDITSDDDNGVRLLLEDDAAQQGVDFSFEGVTKDDTFLAAIMAGTFVDDFTIVITGIGQIDARFFLTSVAIQAAYNDATTFSAEFQSSGAFTYTPVA